MNTLSPVFDVNGVEITTGSIVSFTADYFLDKKLQGMVLFPPSEFEGDEHTVAVYFFSECDKYHLRLFSEEGEKWKRRFSDARKSNEVEFLFKDDNWKQCPFIVFYEPKEIQVDHFWSVSTLVERYFPRHHMVYYQLLENIKKDPSLYQCFLEGCSNQASTLFLYNFWGTVSPMYICRNCQNSRFAGRDRTRGEDMPKLNKPFKLLDGTPVT